MHDFVVNDAFNFVFNIIPRILRIVTCILLCFGI